LTSGENSNEILRFTGVPLKDPREKKIDLTIVVCFSIRVVFLTPDASSTKRGGIY